jgi:MerR family copper efflux transcriptional regulator
MLTIGKVAQRAGVSASAIRFYERRKLLRPSRLLNGYRVYNKSAIKELRFVRQAQSLGITLVEIGRLLELARGGGRPCAGVRELARRHLKEIDVKIRQLQSLRTELRDLLSRRAEASCDELCSLIAAKPRGAKAGADDQVG